MTYDPFKVYDRLRYRTAEQGGARVYARCTAMSGGDRCEYREHGGTHHAALDGSHTWIEEPLGACSICATDQYPLSVTWWSGEGRDYALMTNCCDDGVVVQRRIVCGPDPFGSSAEWSER